LHVLAKGGIMPVGEVKVNQRFFMALLVDLYLCIGLTNSELIQKHLKSMKISESLIYWIIGLHGYSTSQTSVIARHEAISLLSAMISILKKPSKSMKYMTHQSLAFLRVMNILRAFCPWLCC